MNLRPLSTLLTTALLAALSFRAAADAIYLPSTATDTIIRVGANGAQSTFIPAGLINPVGVAFDEAGNLYVSSSGATAGTGSINKYPAGGGAAVPLATALNDPAGLALRGDGFVYAAVSGSNSIVKIPTGGGVPVTFAPLGAGANPQGIAFDANGNLFVANKGGNSISKVTPGGSVSTFANSTDVTAPVGIVVGSTGRIGVYHAENGGEIIEFNANGNGKPKSVIKSLGTPAGLAIDSLDAYYAATTGDKVFKVVGANKTDFVTGISGLGLLTAHAGQLQVVASKTETVDVPLNTKYASFGAPIIGAGGDVAYLGKLVVGISGVTGGTDSGIWKTDNAGTRTLVIREGDTAPDETGAKPTNGPIFGGFSDPVINANGKVAFRGTHLKVNGAVAGTLIGLWAEGTNGLAKVVRQGDEPPGISGAKFTNFQQFALPDAGGLVFLATVSGGGATPATNSGLWADNGAGVQLVVRKGDFISVNGVQKKLLAITLFSKIPFSTGQTRSYATDGRLLFRATFTDKSTAIIEKDFGTPTPRVVTYKNEVVSINPINGARLTNPVTGAVNDDGSVAFRSSLAGGTVASSNNQAVFIRDSANALQIVAQKSFVANDAPDAIFAAFSDPAVNDDGEVAFRATLKPSGPTSIAGRSAGLWLGVAGAPGLVVRQGDTPPGVSGSTHFTAFSQFCAPADGGLVFQAVIAGSGITTANNLGIWQRDPTGALDVVIRKGDTIAIGNSKPKITAITAFKLVPLSSTQGRTVAADGGVVLLLKLSDGNQAIVRAILP